MRILLKINCTDLLVTNLHSNILGPELYPTTHELIIDALKE